MTESEYMNAADAAQYLGVHRSRIYVLADSGRLGRKIAGHYVFTRDELDRYKQEEKSKGGRPRKNPPKCP
jgi:excisionase family DNA binding protein